MDSLYLVDYMLAQGTLKAAMELKRFGNDWIEFGW
jgi:hypothetical protein